mgnify:FL=1
MLTLSTFIWKIKMSKINYKKYEIQDSKDGSMRTYYDEGRFYLEGEHVLVDAYCEKREAVILDEVMVGHCTCYKVKLLDDGKIIEELPDGNVLGVLYQVKPEPCKQPEGKKPKYGKGDDVKVIDLSMANPQHMSTKYNAKILDIKSIVRYEYLVEFIDKTAIWVKEELVCNKDSK